MTESNETRSEILLRFSRRSMLTTLLLILLIGAVALAAVLDPAGPMARWIEQRSYLVVIAIIIAIGVLQLSLRGQRFNARGPEERAILNDEWRTTNMDRARRGAFLSVLITQVPLALLFSSLPSTRAVMAMAVSSILVGMVVLIGAFLFFDREQGADG